ncbi:MAG TPA: response regulator, partial [Acidimicrobiales bacterium]
MIGLAPDRDDVDTAARIRHAQVLLIDDATAVNELLAREVESRLGCHVTAIPSVEELLSRDELDDFDLALVDLAFAYSPLTGLDALYHLHTTSPRTTLAIITQGDEWLADLLRHAWEAFPIATAISKNASITALLDAIAGLL